MWGNPSGFESRVAHHRPSSSAKTIPGLYARLALGLFASAYEGSIEFDPLPTDWASRMARRIETGLFTPGSRRRANYVVRSKSSDAVSFSADDFWTALSVGLNDVELRRADGNRVAYQGSFRRWATYAAIQGLAVVGAVLLVVLLLPGARDEVARYGGWGWPLLIILLAFFGLVLPRLLVVMHRRFASQALERIIREAVAA